MHIAGWFTRAVIFTLVSAAVIVASAPAGTIAATGGVQYDQVMRFQMPGMPTPTPDDFAATFKSAVDASVAFNNRPSMHGFLNMIKNAGSIEQSTMAMIKAGMPMTYYFLNDWERQDDPGKQTADIYRPDRKQIIHLNLAKKTYTIEDLGSSTPSPEQPAQPPTQPNQPPQSPQPGTANVDVTMSSSLLGPKSIDGVQTTGYHSDFKVVTTQATGSCQNGSYEASLDDYVSAFVPPNAQLSDFLKHALSSASPAMYVERGGCTPTVTTHKAVGATAPSGHLSLWQVMTFKSGQSNGQSENTYIERGNVRTLGPGDAGLFDVPPGFTKG